MIDIVPRINQAVRRHRTEHVARLHAVQNPVSLIGLMRLDRMKTALGKMERHRPVVRNRVHDISHPRMHGSLSRPYMGRDHRNVFRNGAVNRRHQLRVLLVGAVIGQFPESLVIHRLPEQLVEKPALLGQSGTHGIQIVLSADDFRTGRMRISVQVHPVRRISEGMRRRRHRHGDPVMTESHPDIAYDHAFSRIKSRAVPGLRTVRRYTFTKTDLVQTEAFRQHMVLLQRRRVVQAAVVSVFADHFLFGFFRFPVVFRTDRIPEDH